MRMDSFRVCSAGDHLFDITHTHEALQGNSNTKALFHSEEDADELVTRLFEAPDGFRGTFDQVLEHEAKLGIGNAPASTLNSQLGFGFRRLTALFSMSTPLRSSRGRHRAGSAPRVCLRGTAAPRRPPSYGAQE